MSTLIFDVLFKAAEKVKLFGSNIVGLQHANKPELLSPERFKFRSGHLIEELNEMKDAQDQGNLTEVSDSLIDLIYIELGMLNEMGVAFQPAFEEVHNANMRKARGELAKRPGALGFDAVKPQGWTGPDYSFLLSLSTEDMETLKALKENRAYLMLNNTNNFKKKLVVIGYGGHGKDTVCEMLRDTYGYTFESSSKFCAEHVILPKWNKLFPNNIEVYDPTNVNSPYITLGPYASVESCFNDRRHSAKHRAIWFAIISEYLGADKARLGNEILCSNDIYCGVRNVEELDAIKKQGLVDCVIWVDAGDRVPRESLDSCTVSPKNAHYVLNNSGTPGQLAANVEQMAIDLNL